MMEFARFVGGTRGLGDTNLSHQGGVLEGTIEGFLNELGSESFFSLFLDDHEREFRTDERFGWKK